MQKQFLHSFLITVFLLPAASIASDFMILVGTDVFPENRFESWEAENPGAYSGMYLGDVGGDGEGRMAISLAENRQTLSGTYELRVHGYASDENASGIQVSKVKFDNIFRYNVSHTVEDQFAALAIRFVEFEGEKGCIVGRVFLPKQQAE